MDQAPRLYAKRGRIRRDCRGRGPRASDARLGDARDRARLARRGLRRAGLAARPRRARRARPHAISLHHDPARDVPLARVATRDGAESGIQRGECVAASDVATLESLAARAGAGAGDIAHRSAPGRCPSPRGARRLADTDASRARGTPRRDQARVDGGCMRRRFGPLLIALSLALGLAVPLLYGGSAAFTELARLPVWAYLPLAAMVVLAWMCNAARLYLLGRGLHHPLEWRTACNIVVAADFAGAVTPGRGAGGGGGGAAPPPPRCPPPPPPPVGPPFCRGGPPPRSGGGGGGAFFFPPPPPPLP